MCRDQVLAALALTTLFPVSVVAVAAEPQYKPVPAALVRARDGLGNVSSKLATGEEVRIAYFGGSITAADGWRIKTREWFAHTFTKAKVSEINAAIGGTGSDLGVFRLKHDVLDQRPDLVFIEFSVNDGGAPPEQIWQAIDGIVRQIWMADPRTDICFVYTFRLGYEKDLGRRLCPRAASATEMLAEHYGIPSINVALKIVELQKQGKLIYKSDEPASGGMIRFSRDGVHPLDRGHQVYTNVIADAVTAMQETSKPIDHAGRLVTPFVADTWQAAKMVPLSKSMLTGDWALLPKDSPLVRSFGRRMGPLWEATTPGSRITFRFRGSQAKLYDLLGPDGGQVIITVDGRTRRKPVPRFDSYCTYHRIATLDIAAGLDPSAVHTVTIEIHPEQPDRRAVAFRLKDPDVELAGAKYQGTKVRASQILLLGDLVE